MQCEDDRPLQIKMNSLEAPQPDQGPRVISALSDVRLRLLLARRPGTGFSLVWCQAILRLGLCRGEEEIDPYTV